MRFKRRTKIEITKEDIKAAKEEFFDNGGKIEKINITGCTTSEEKNYLNTVILEEEYESFFL